MAYAQGVYIAKQLNGDEWRPFKLISDGEEADANSYNVSCKGSAIKLWDGQVLIDNHTYLPDGVYSKYIIKLYSTFFV